jgi:DUF4097 and DUF4098 domain-containing protein YvlB
MEFNPAQELIQMKNLRAIALLTFLTPWMVACNHGPMREGSFQKTLKVGSKATLKVETHAGNITVHTGPAQSIIISGHIRARGGFPGPSGESKVEKIASNPPISQDGNSIHISGVEGSDLRRNVFVDYDITVPDDTELNATSGAGNVRIKGLTQKVDGTTGAGTIATETVAGDEHLRTGAGSIEVISPLGLVMAESGAGRITARGEPKNNWDLRVGAGSIKMEIPSSASFDLEAKTGFGKINLGQGFELQDGKISNSHVEGKIGKGGPRVVANNGAGAIDISRGMEQN